MKKSHILAIAVIAVAVGIMIATVGDTSVYVTFAQAKSMDDKVHVVGSLPKDNSGKATGIHPSADKLSFSFTLIDEDHTSQRVFYNEPIPADFHRSEQVVIIGSYKNDLFVADKILLKCPSKYQEETVNASL